MSLPPQHRFDRGEQTRALLRYAQAAATFLSACARPFATIPAPSGGLESCPVRSRPFRDWLLRHFYNDYETAPTEYALRHAVRTVEARARDSAAPPQNIGVRVNALGRNPYRPSQIVVDLATATGETVAISHDGWTVTTAPICSFERFPNTNPLDTPQHAAAAETPALTDFFDLSPEAAETLQNWLVSALHPAGPHPVLVIAGPPRSGKSMLARTLRALVDPSPAPLFQFPLPASKITTLARQNWVLAFDSVRRIAPSAAQVLKSLASGEGLAIHHRDGASESIARPIILVIDEGAQLPESLAARAVTLHLPALTTKLPEADIHEHFAAARPALQAALYTAVARTLTATDTHDPAPDATFATAHDASPFTNGVTDSIAAAAHVTSTPPDRSHPSLAALPAPHISPLLPPSASSCAHRAAPASPHNNLHSVEAPLSPHSASPQPRNSAHAPGRNHMELRRFTNRARATLPLTIRLIRFTRSRFFASLPLAASLSPIIKRRSQH